MKWLKLKRTLREGYINFKRNGWLSFATVAILTLSLFVISITLILGVTANLILREVQNKVSVSVYFNPEVKESEIIEIKEKLEQYSEVKSVDYISQNKAFDDFVSAEGGEKIITQALEEIGENPFLSSLEIKAEKPDQYELITNSIKDSAFKNKINRINYDRNKSLIERLIKIVKVTERGGIALGGIFILIAILVTFNTIRMTIYSQKQEFEVKRLVGASNLYVKVPYIYEGMLYGLVASIVATILVFGAVNVVSPLTQGAIPQGNLFQFCLQYSWIILLFDIVFGIILGVISSLIAIRKYLNT